MNFSDYFISLNFAKVQTYSDLLDPESFIIKILYEVGILGILLFIPLAKNYISFKNTFTMLMSSIFVVGSFLTPAFSGSIFPIIILPYLLKKRC